MKLLVVGSGGREHAIAKKLLESKDVEQVFVAPGNDGMRLDGLDLINIGISEHSKLIDFAKANDIAWTFIGPDDALAAGIVDDFNAAGLKAFGPTKAAAELEWSKDFAKEIMVKYDVPTAAYGTFSDFEEAKAYIEEKGAPIVVKADGLALGKGVVVAERVAARTLREGGGLQDWAVFVDILCFNTQPPEGGWTLHPQAHHSDIRNRLHPPGRQVDKPDSNPARFCLKTRPVPILRQGLLYSV